MALTATEETLLRDLLAKQAQLIALANNETTITAKLGSTKATIDDLTAATTVADADLMIVRQNGVDKKLPVSVVKSDLVDLSSYAPLASPALTDVPTAPTAAAGTNTKQIATTEFVQGEKPADATQAEMEAGTETAIRGMSPLRVRQAISALASTPFASSAENAGGTIEGKAVDPLGIREAFNASGSAPVYACRAWVNFDGTGTVVIRASGNVSSITDNGTGDYTVNFSSGMPDGSYSVVVSSGITDGSAFAKLNPAVSPTSSGFRMSVHKPGGPTYDAGVVCAAVYR